MVWSIINMSTNATDARVFDLMLNMNRMYTAIVFSQVVPTSDLLDWSITLNRKKNANTAMRCFTKMLFPISLCKSHPRSDVKNPNINHKYNPARAVVASNDEAFSGVDDWGVLFIIITKRFLFIVRDFRSHECKSNPRLVI